MPDDGRLTQFPAVGGSNNFFASLAQRRFDLMLEPIVDAVPE
jgi:hypothetical protein